MKSCEFTEERYEAHGKEHPYDVGYSGDLVDLWNDANRDPDFGPHEGKELGMMLKGVKPAAMINGDVYRNIFEKYIKSGDLVSLEIDPDHYAVALPKEKDRLLKVKKWLHAEDSKKRHIALGRLLGYPKSSIKKFIDTR